jgi:hypothetical protein
MQNNMPKALTLIDKRKGSFFIKAIDKYGSERWCEFKNVNCYAPITFIRCQHKECENDARDLSTPCYSRQQRIVDSIAVNNSFADSKSESSDKLVCSIVLENNDKITYQFINSKLEKLEINCDISEPAYYLYCVFQSIEYQTECSWGDRVRKLVGIRIAGSSSTTVQGSDGF